MPFFFFLQKRRRDCPTKKPNLRAGFQPPSDFLCVQSKTPSFGLLFLLVICFIFPCLCFFSLGQDPPPGGCWSLFLCCPSFLAFLRRHLNNKKRARSSSSSSSSGLLRQPPPASSGSPVLRPVPFISLSMATDLKTACSVLISRFSAPCVSECVGVCVCVCVSGWVGAHRLTRGRARWHDP